MRCFMEEAKTTVQKYDLWKAMDFEKYLCILKNFEFDYAFRIFKFIQGMTGKEELEMNPIEIVQFKQINSSPIFERKFNRTTKF